MALENRHALSLAVSTHAANHHEVTLAQLSFDFYRIEAKPENVIGDRAYDSDKLNDEWPEQGMEMIALHRAGRTMKRTQHGRCLRRYKRCWLIKRYFAWLQWKRLMCRWEYYAENFLGLVEVACRNMLLKRI